jgi:hypothetical protein
MDVSSLPFWALHRQRKNLGRVSLVHYRAYGCLARRPEAENLGTLYNPRQRGFLFVTNDFRTLWRYSNPPPCKEIKLMKEREKGKFGQGGG